MNLRVRGRDYPLRSTISALDTGDAGIHLRDGATLPCSRRYRAALRERTA